MTNIFLSLIAEFHCCNQTTDLNCAQSCKQILQTIKTEQHIVDALIAVCGLPFAIDPSPNVSST